MENTVRCICGCLIIKTSLDDHLKTSKHLRRLNRKKFNQYIGSYKNIPFITINI